MQALILATGETQKLKPLAGQIPSPLIPIMNRPIMDYNLELLGRLGFKRILVSLYSLASSIEGYFGDGQRWGLSLEYVLQRDALGSAGALRLAKQHLQEPFIIMPADQVADLEIAQAIGWHVAQQSQATVIVQPGPPQASRALRIDAYRRIRVDGRGLTSAPGWIDTGIYLFDPCILERIPPNRTFEIHLHLLPRLLAEGVPVLACPLPGYWNPLETLQDYAEAQRVFFSRALKDEAQPDAKVTYRYNTLESRQIDPGIWVGRDVKIHPSARVAQPVSIGRNSWIGKDVELGPSAVVGSNVVIDQGATIQHSIVLDHTYVGKLVHLENRLVNQDRLIDLCTNENIQVTDPIFLGKVE